MFQISRTLNKISDKNLENNVIEICKNTSALKVLFLLQYICSNWLSLMFYYFACHINQFFNCFYRNVWGLWGKSKLYEDLWWRGNQLHWICATAPLWMRCCELLHTSDRWPVVYTRYGLQMLTLWCPWHSLNNCSRIEVFK